MYKATFFYFMGNILTRFSGFILLPLYTNILTPDDYGNYAILMAIYAILNVLYQAGLFQGLIRFFYDKNLDPKRVVSTTLNTIVVFGFTLTLLLSLFNKPLIKLLNLDKNLNSLLLLLLWIIFFDTIAYFGLHFLRVKRLSKRAVSYSVITAVINLILNVLFLIVLRLNILGILLAQGLANLFLLVLCFQHLKGYYTLVLDHFLLKRLLLFSYPLVIAGIFGILMNVADRFIIDHFMIRSQVGIYSVAYKLGLLMNVLVIAFRTAYLPHFLSKDDNTGFPGSKISGELGGELRQTFTRLISLMMILFLTMIFFLKYLFRIEIGGFHLINPEYIQAIYIVPFIVLAYSFNGLAAFFSLAPYRSGKSYQFVITDVIGFSLNIALNFILIPLYGIMGAALATLIGYYGAAFYMYFVFCNEMKESVFNKNTAVIVAGSLISLSAASVIDLLFVRIILLSLFILYCLRITKLNPVSFFRLTANHSNHN
jgi:O-antigen/teichoic acid export membrane protein